MLASVLQAASPKPWLPLGFAVHQAVLECLAANESTYKFKPSVALKRHQSLNELDVQDDDVALADASEQVPANDPAENAVAVAVN